MGTAEHEKGVDLNCVYPGDSVDQVLDEQIRGVVPDCLINYPGLKVKVANGQDVALGLWAKVLAWHFYNGRSVDWIRSFRNVTGVSLQDAKVAWDSLPKIDNAALEGWKKEAKRNEVARHGMWTELLEAREEIKELKSILKRYL